MATVPSSSSASTTVSMSYPPTRIPRRRGQVIREPDGDNENMSTEKDLGRMDDALLESGTWLVVVKGQCGGGAVRIDKFLPQWHDPTDPERDRVVTVDNPYPLFSDLGQYACMNRFHEVMKRLAADPYVSSIVIHASSQGTGTVMNYFAAYPENTKKVRFVILEGVLASSNLTIRNAMSVNETPLLPYVLPFLGPIYGMLGFWPAGPQGLTSVSKWPTHLRQVPIFILNAEQDRDTPACGARAIYTLLKKAGFEHAHLMIVPGVGHVDLIECHLEPSPSPSASSSSDLPTVSFLEDDYDEVDDQAKFGGPAVPSDPTELPKDDARRDVTDRPSAPSPLCTLHSLLKHHLIDYCEDFIPADPDSDLRPALPPPPPRESKPSTSESSTSVAQRTMHRQANQAFADTQPDITPEDEAQVQRMLCIEERITMVALLLVLGPLFLWFFVAELFVTATFLWILLCVWLWMHVIFFGLHLLFRFLLAVGDFGWRDWMATLVFVWILWSIGRSVRLV